MIPLFRAALLLAALPLAAMAEDAPVLAEYRADSGSLPPQHAWETTVTIREDGALTLTHCAGYETGGPACKMRRATVDAAALEAIRAAARASGLAADPAREAELLAIGGGQTSAIVRLDGAEIALLAQPDARDADRVAKVLAAIDAAIPARFDRFLKD